MGNNGEVISKLEPVLSLLHSYIGQTIEHSLDVIEVLIELFVPIFDIVAVIGVPTSNLSDIEKIQIGIIRKFYDLIIKCVS